MSKHAPKNREEAFVYQFEDDVKLLFSMSQIGVKEFQQELEKLKGHIVSYEQMAGKKPLCSCGRELQVTYFCNICDNDE